ncbi:MAG TPA: glycosyl hydrolase [Gaiellaceae bacterium]|nr:glycosyl hydrolase [Gaiellaceae bacterium]
MKSLALLLLVIGCLAATGCASDPEEPRFLTGCGAGRDGAGRSDSRLAVTRALGSTPRPPRLGGKASIAGTPPPTARPTRGPDAASERLRGHPLPTNQWWTSALVGPWSEPLVAGPLAVRAEPAGVTVSYQPPVVSPNHVIQPFAPSVRVGGALTRMEVECYGAFHVVLDLVRRSGSRLRAIVVQGSPIVWFQFAGSDPPELGLTDASGVRANGSELEGVVAGRRWYVAASSGTWERRAADAVLRGAREGGVTVAVSPAPDRGGNAWADRVSAAARRPPLDTTEEWEYLASRGTARQELRVIRAGGGGGPWALTPLQRRLLDGPTRELARYASSRGTMLVVDAHAIVLEASSAGFVPGVPRFPLGAGPRAAVVRALRADLAARPMDGGSYFGAKEAARLAAIADVASAVGRRELRVSALARLRRQLVDWLTYTGPADGRYLAYDATWGGLVAVPSEFGAHDYNDHHLQFGYLVRAAATLAEADPRFLRGYGSAVDAIVRDFAGGSASGPRGFPSERVWNAGQGHSYASGYALFADGNNQESSSEAVAAWAAVARWGLAAGRPRLAGLGLARYALEAAAARTYWLGEGSSLPGGYEHALVGIVWGAKIDYATWFSPAPAAIHGIQLLPVDFSSLYRSDPASARSRVRAHLREAGGTFTQWGNLFAVEQALFDPTAARRTLTQAGGEAEPSTSAGLVRYLVEVLARTGPPDASVVADPPYGIAMRRGGAARFLTVNPTRSAATVRFLDADGRVLTRRTAPARGGSSAVRR